MWLDKNAVEYAGIQMRGQKRPGNCSGRMSVPDGSLRHETPFGDRLPGLLFFLLYDSSLAAPFGSWLKHFLYQRAGFSAPYDLVPDSAYKAYMLQSFRDTKTPVSFSDSSVKTGKMIDTCLHAGHVGRETAFLIGLGLGMTAGEVSDLLVKGLHEENFCELDPVDVIIWWALKHHLAGEEAVNLVKAFRNREYPKVHPYAAGEIPDFSSQEGLFRYIRLLDKELDAEEKRKTEVFRCLFDRSLSLIRDLYGSDPVFPKRWEGRITAADVENVLYCGIPKNAGGNLLPCSRSYFGPAVSAYRLTRQRLARILAGKAKIMRHDLLTLLFLVYALTDNKDAYSRYSAFQREAGAIQDACLSFSIAPHDLYDRFLLLCLRTDWPLETFAFVWELSFRKAG